jgi:phage FluMu protein gp41
MSNVRSIVETVKAAKGPIVVQRLSLKIGKDLNRLAAENGTLDGASFDKLKAEALALGVAI